jgi:hypothetical protein
MNKLNKDIELFVKLAKEANAIDLTKIEEFSFSCIVRALRKHLDYKDVMKFIKFFKTEFDDAIINKVNKPAKIALEKAVASFSDLFDLKFSKNLVKEAFLTNEKVNDVASHIVNTRYRMKTAQLNSVNVSEQEKYQAKKTLLMFKYCIKFLTLATDHLNLIKTPFKDNESADPESVWKNRSSFRLFRDKVVENFNEFKLMSFKAISSLHLFSSDMQIIKLMKSFISSVDTLEKKVNDFINCFDDLKSEDFSKNIVDNITGIEKQCEEIEDLINVRIKSYIQENILSSNWIEEVGAKHNLDMDRKQPLLLELSEKFNEELNKGEV